MKPSLLPTRLYRSQERMKISSCWKSFFFSRIHYCLWFIIFASCHWPMLHYFASIGCKYSINAWPRIRVYIFNAHCFAGTPMKVHDFYPAAYETIYRIKNKKTGLKRTEPKTKQETLFLLTIPTAVGRYWVIHTRPLKFTQQPAQFCRHTGNSSSTSYSLNILVNVFSRRISQDVPHLHKSETKDRLCKCSTTKCH